MPSTMHRVEVRLYHQILSKEYVEFLRDENQTNTRGDSLYDLWATHGRSTPELMATTIFPPCPILQTGDLNVDAVVNSADIITLVNYVFKSGPDPLPCVAAADTDCSGTVSAADIIQLVNYVFKAGPGPCDVCALMPDIWLCP